MFLIGQEKGKEKEEKSMKKIQQPVRPRVKPKGKVKQGLSIMAKSDQTHFAPRRNLKV